jgi:hypothetical protein
MIYPYVLEPNTIQRPNITEEMKTSLAFNPSCMTLRDRAPASKKQSWAKLPIRVDSCPFVPGLFKLGLVGGLDEPALQASALSGADQRASDNVRTPAEMLTEAEVQK